MVELLESRQLLEGAPLPSQPPAVGPIGDLNGDGQVDLNDFSAFKSLFLEPGTDTGPDLNGDGVVDLSDFRLLKSNFGAVSWGVSDPLSCDISDPYTCVGNPPVADALPAVRDPFAGEPFRLEHVFVQGVLKWTFEYYPDGSRRSEFWHDLGKRRVYYPDGRMFSENFEGGALTEYYLDEPALAASTSAHGRVAQRVRDDGREWRFTYWGDEPQRFEESFLVNGELRSLNVFYSDGTIHWRSYVHPDAGDRRLEVFYPSGRLKLRYNYDTREFTTYLDEEFRLDSVGNPIGRTVADGSFATWKQYTYHPNSGVPKTIVTWLSGQVYLTETYLPDGQLAYRTLPPQRRSTAVVQRNGNGMAIRPASDQILNFTYIPGEWQLRTGLDLDSLWVSAFRIELRDGANLQDQYQQSRGTFSDLVSNFQTNNPDITIGSYHSFLYAKQEATIEALDIYPRDAFELNNVPASYLSSQTGADATTGDTLWLLDITKPEVREHLIESLVSLGIGNEDRPRLDTLFLDNVAITSNWPEKREILTEVKRRLNEAGVFLDLNVGGWGYTDTPLPNITDPIAELAAVGNGINIESPWRLNDRTVASTTQVIRNFRRLLDEGVSVGIITAHFDRRKTTNITTIPRPILSIQEVERDFGEGRTQRGLLVTTDGEHDIFPTGGFTQDSVIFQDLPDAYRAWQDASYTPYEVPGNGNQVLLYIPGGDVRQAGASFGTRYTGSGTLFNKGELRRLYAAFAMMIRESGDSIGVHMTMGVEQPGGGDPNNPDNWTTWPAQFGRPLGDYVIEVPHNVAPTSPAAATALVMKISRQFEHGQLIVYPQEGRVEAIFSAAAAMAPTAAAAFQSARPAAAAVGIALALADDAENKPGTGEPSSVTDLLGYCLAEEADSDGPTVLSARESDAAPRLSPVGPYPAYSIAALAEEEFADLWSDALSTGL